MDILDPIYGILFDIDGCIMPEGGPIDTTIAAIIRQTMRFVPMGPATAKSSEYARGLAVGIGAHWKYVVARSGLEVLFLEEAGNPPRWSSVSPTTMHTEDLNRLLRMVVLGPTSDIVELFSPQILDYRLLQTENSISLFSARPNGSSESKTEIEKLRISFESIIEKHTLALEVRKYSNGSICIVPNDIDKYSGSEMICKRLGCDRASLLTIGNSADDLGLIRGTTAIAPSNAEDVVKALVKSQGGFVADHPDGTGLAQGLLHFSELGWLPPEIRRIVRQYYPTLNARA